MKCTHSLSLALIMALSAPISQVYADQDDSHHAGSTAMTAGEVKKVDKDAAKSPSNTARSKTWLCPA